MKKIVLTIALLFIICALPLALYFIKFGLNSDFSLNLTLTNELEKWAAFGSYIGGTLGPLFSALAFIVIWLTYKAQREQISLLSNQAKINEIQRIIFVTSERIDKILELNAKIIKPAHELEFDDTPESLTEFATISSKPFIDVLFHLATTDPKKMKLPPELDEAIWHNYTTKHKIIFAENIISFNVELKQLSWLFNEFSIAGGDDKVIEFYKRRFQRAVELLNEINCLNAPLVEKYFDMPQIKPTTEDRFFKIYIAPKL